MVEVLREVENIIKNDTELKTLCNAEDNRQFIYVDVMPFDTQLPAIILSFGHYKTFNPYIDTLNVTFDIFDKAKTHYRLLKIVERLEYLLLNYKSKDVTTNRIRSIVRDYGTLFPDKEEDIQHYILNVSIYFSRNELL